MINCPVCHNYINENNFKRSFISPYNNENFKLYHCEQCLLEFWEPRAMAPEFYEEEGVSGYYSLHEGCREHLSQSHKPFIKRFPFNYGKLLDVGCGDGIFMNYARDIGFDVWGIDFDKKSIRVTKDRFGLKNTFAMTLEQFVAFAQERGLKFDVVTFFEVLEHQDNPKKFLSNVKKLLINDGFVAGSVPNRDRVFADMERHDFGDRPPHHFLWFSKESLRNFFVYEELFNIEFYTATMRPLDLSAWLESSMFGDLSFRVKSRIKNYLLKGSIKSKRELSAGVSDLAKKYNDPNIYFLQMLRRIRNLVFLPATLLLYPIVRLNGQQIYFQAKLSGNK